MRLLVSVRSAAEVAAAARGRGRHRGRQGAGARLARRGERRVAAGDRRRVPAERAAQRGAGRLRRRGSRGRAVAAGRGCSHGLAPAPRRGYLKIGFRRRAIASAVARLLGAAVDAACGRDPAIGRRRLRMPITSSAGVPAPGTVAGAGRGRRRRGVLLDTWSKDGGDLFHGSPSPRFARGGARPRAAGLLVALAGSPRIRRRPMAVAECRRTSSAFAGRPVSGGGQGPGGARSCVPPPWRSWSRRAPRSTCLRRECRERAHRPGASEERAKFCSPMQIGHVQPGHSACRFEGA